MQILRSTMYPPPGGGEPTTVVARQRDLKLPIDEAARKTWQPGAFVATEIFAMPGKPSIEEATIEAMKLFKRRAPREIDMSILYHWDAMQLLRLKEHGVLSGTKPAPLTVAEVQVVLEQLGLHPNYKHQTVQVMAEDLTLLRMKDGKVEIMSKEK